MWLWADFRNTSSSLPGVPWKEKVFSDYQQTIANHDYTARNLPSSFFSFDPEILFSPWSLKAVLVTVLWQWLCNLPILALEWRRRVYWQAHRGLERPFLSQLARRAGSLRRLSTGLSGEGKGKGGGGGGWIPSWLHIGRWPPFSLAYKGE